MVYEKVSYAKTITSLVNQGKSREALSLFSRLGSSSITEFALSATLRACARIAAVTEGQQLHCLATKRGLAGDLILTTSLLDMYCKSTRLEEARQVFHEMPYKDIVAKNTMLSGLSRCESTSEEAERLFDTMAAERNVDSWNTAISTRPGGLSVFAKMRSEGVRPDGLTMATILSKCADLAAVSAGKQAHGLAIRLGHGRYVPVGNATVDMYAKCGDARGLVSSFEEVEGRNVVTWTALIAGLGRQGMGVEALESLEAMERERVRVAPNGVTYLAALQACSHSGMVREGLRVFKSMKGVEAGVEHYTCIVDMLGRAGMVDEAWRIVQAMPVKPDSRLLAALLSSCRSHRGLICKFSVEKKI